MLNTKNGPKIPVQHDGVLPKLHLGYSEITLLLMTYCERQQLLQNERSAKDTADKMPARYCCVAWAKHFADASQRKQTN